MYLSLYILAEIAETRGACLPACLTGRERERLRVAVLVVVECVCFNFSVSGEHNKARETSRALIGLRDFAFLSLSPCGCAQWGLRVRALERFDCAFLLQRKRETQKSKHTRPLGRRSWEQRPSPRCKKREKKKVHSKN